MNSKVTKEAEQMSEKGDLKGRIKNLLKTRSYNEITDIAKRDKGVIRRIISLAYDKDDVISWRAMEAMGTIAGEFSIGQARERVDIIRDTIRRLLWSMSEESGGIGWSAAEMLGEIIRSNPDEFIDIIPIVWSFRDEEMFRPGVLRAIGRIGGVRPDLVQQSIPVVLNEYLDHPDPSVRGNAACLLGEIKLKEALSRLERMVDDNSRFMIYEHGRLSERAVGDAAKEAIAKIRIGR